MELETEIQTYRTRLGQQQPQVQRLQDRIQQLTGDHDNLQDEVERHRQHKEKLEEKVMILFFAASTEIYLHGMCALLSEH